MFRVLIPLTCDLGLTLGSYEAQVYTCFIVSYVFLHQRFKGDGPI